MANDELLNMKLRRATRDDANLIERWRSQKGSTRFQASPKRTVEQIRTILAETESADLSPHAIGRFYWLGELAGDPVSQVQIAIDQRDRIQNSATLGYTVDEELQGRGFATATVRAALSIAFDPKGFAIERLEAVAAVENAASRRVLEKTGFQFEGILRGLLIINGKRVDHACYAMLNTDCFAGVRD